LNAEVSDERRMRISSGSTGVNVARGTSSPKVAVPSTMTAMMYQRARTGKSRSNTDPVYRPTARQGAPVREIRQRVASV
jgi:hypothetical protein